MRQQVQEWNRISVKLFTRLITSNVHTELLKDILWGEGGPCVSRIRIRVLICGVKENRGKAWPA